MSNILDCTANVIMNVKVIWNAIVKSYLEQVVLIPSLQSLKVIKMKRYEKYFNEQSYKAMKIVKS